MLLRQASCHKSAPSGSEHKGIGLTLRGTTRAHRSSLIEVSATRLSGLLSRTRRSIGDCIVVYDDFDLPIGKVRIRSPGGAEREQRSASRSLRRPAPPGAPGYAIGVRLEGESRKAGDLVLLEFNQEHEQRILWH